MSSYHLSWFMIVTYLWYGPSVIARTSSRKERRGPSGDSTSISTTSTSVTSSSGVWQGCVKSLIPSSAMSVLQASIFIIFPCPHHSYLTGARQQGIRMPAMWKVILSLGGRQSHRFYDRHFQVRRMPCRAHRQRKC